MDFGRGRIKGSYSTNKCLEDCNVKDESYPPRRTETPYAWDATGRENASKLRRKNSIPILNSPPQHVRSKERKNLELNNSWEGKT